MSRNHCFRLLTSLSIFPFINGQIYNPPGSDISVVVGNIGESCSGACHRNNLVCTPGSLKDGNDYLTSITMKSTLNKLGGNCRGMHPDETEWMATPQAIAPLERSWCFPSTQSRIKRLNCDFVSNLENSHRLCSCRQERECIAPTGIPNSASSFCAEGSVISENGVCTPSCAPGYASSYATLTCVNGELKPPGLLLGYFANAEVVLACEKPDPIPTRVGGTPGTKRGWNVWRLTNQDDFYYMFNASIVGWWYNGALRPHPRSFTTEEEKKDLYESSYWPSLLKRDSVHEPLYTGPSPNYIGSLNEPYGENQANMTPQEVVDWWPTFEGIVEELATAKNVSTSEIQICAPSTGPGQKAFDWFETFYPMALAAGIRLDVLDVHSYTVRSDNKECSAEQLRDEMSYLRFKFGMPVWLTEFNCGNGYWNYPREKHVQFMKEALGMLEAHPWVPRYVWFSTLVEMSNKGSAMVEIEDKSEDKWKLQFTELGEYYNTFVWDGQNSPNPSWPNGAVVETMSTDTLASDLDQAQEIRVATKEPSNLPTKVPGAA